MVTRREFLAAAAFSCVGSGFSRTFPGRTVNAAATMQLGYAGITWGNNVTQAIEDIAAVGFRGIQLRAGDGTVDRYGANPAALRELLDRHRLAFAVLSSGNLSIDPAREREMLATHLAHAKFLRDAGGRYLQIIDERPKGRAVTADDYRRLGRLLTELGRRTMDLGVTVAYHHHMNSTGEKPHEIAAVLDAADRKHVRLLFDVAHYQQGGGDPVAAIRQYKDWIEVVHLKDVRPSGSGGSGGSGGADGSGGSGAGYQFVELGRGRVDLPGVFAALRDISFDKWAVVELDRVPDPGRTPKESAEMNKKYLAEHGFTV
jgi:inosose dehydratase